MRGNQDGNSVTVAIVEDEGLFRSLLESTISNLESFQVVGAFARPDHALKEIPRLKPDVAVLDIELAHRMTGVQLGLALRRQLPDLGIVLLSNHCDPEFLASIPPNDAAGWSYLLKKSVEHVDALTRAIKGSKDGLVLLDPQLIASVRSQHDGPSARLTPRQEQVLKLIAQGYTNAAIARQLSLSEKTIQNQINLIYDKLAIDRTDSDVQPRVKAVLTYLHDR